MGRSRAARRWLPQTDQPIETVMQLDPPLLVVPFYRDLVSWLADGDTDATTGAHYHNTLTVWFDGRSWRASLHNKARRIVAFLRGPSLEHLIAQADAGLSLGALEWKKSAARD